MNWPLVRRRQGVGAARQIRRIKGGSLAGRGRGQRPGFVTRKPVGQVEIPPAREKRHRFPSQRIRSASPIHGPQRRD
jgi:hypothetical protein